MEYVIYFSKDCNDTFNNGKFQILMESLSSVNKVFSYLYNKKHKV